LYLEGKGVAKDIEQAKIWLEQAAFYDDKNAKKVLRRLKSNS
jgi:TPR repeat protein